MVFLFEIKALNFEKRFMKDAHPRSEQIDLIN